jgi:hypothetical protein
MQLEPGCVKTSKVAPGNVGRTFPHSTCTVQPPPLRSLVRKTKALTQCYALQDLLFQAAHESDCSKADRARLALAWERLEERKRILRRVPLPGSYRPKEKEKRPSYSHWETPALIELPPDPSDEGSLRDSPR